MLQLGAKGLRLFVVDEVVAVDAPRRHGVDDAVDDLLQRGLALGCAERAAEVLLGEDVGRVERPRRGHLNVELFEGHRTVSKVGDARFAKIPGHLVVGVTILGGEVPTNSNSESLRCDGHISLLSFLTDTRTQSGFEESGSQGFVTLGPLATRCSGCSTPRRKMLCHYSTVITRCQLLL